MKKITTIFIFLCAFRINAEAQQDLLKYDLSSSNAAATFTNSDITANSIILSSGSILFTNSPSSIYTSTWPTSTSFNTSGKYWQFSFGHNSGKQILLGSITFNVGRTTTGPTNIQVQYSLDGFTTSGIDAGSFTTANTTSLDQLTLVNLPSSVFTNTITFRIWGYNASSSGNFRLNNVVIKGEISTLPISLTSFTAKAVNQNIQLNWKTASEENNAYFEIKRSADGKNFSPIGEIKGAGNSSILKDYTFTDYNPLAGTNYYQLFQHDFDGKTSSSQIVAVKSKISKSELSAFATSSGILINLSSPNQTEGTFQIFDINGRKLATHTTNFEKGLNNINIPIILEKGIYLIHYISKEEILDQKFIK